MFDFGFFELLLVSIVALLVIGPDRLPETIRTMMVWLGKIRASFTNIKMEIEQEIGMDEIRQQIHNESIMQELEKSKQQIQETIKTADNTLSEIKNSVNNPLQSELPQEETDQQSIDDNLIQNDPDEPEPGSDEPKQSESGR